MTNKHNNKFVENKWVKLGVIPVILLGLWFLLTFWYSTFFDNSISVISYNLPASNIVNLNHNRLLKGQMIKGSFVAKDDNLGIVSIRFQSFQRIPYDEEDTLIFRIKEKGQKDWLSQNYYRSGLTYDVPFLPFGFPVIPNSKGKTYQFELLSMHGNNINGVALSTRQPILVTKYKVSKSLLLHSPQALFKFIFEKTINSFQTIDISYSSVFFGLPLIFYLLLSSRLHRYIPRYSLPLLLVILVFFDVLFLQIVDSILFIEVPVLWLFLMKTYKLDSRYTFGIGLFFLVFAPIYLQLNIENTAEVAAAWAFMFFVAGLIQSLIEVGNITS